MLEDVGNDAGAVYHTTHVNLARDLEMPNEEIQWGVTGSEHSHPPTREAAGW